MRWIWVVLLAACGDNVVPRLEPVTYDLAGTPYVSPVFFHDRARDETCGPVGWADGATYCTPSLLPVAYLDAACSEAVAMGDTGYAPTMFTIAGKRSVRRVHPVVPRATPAQYWISGNGSCDGPYPAAADMKWGDLSSDELDESAFVRLYRSAPEGSSRLQVVALNTLDGIHAPRAMHDRDLGFDCVFVDGRDRDRVACLPPDAADAAFFLDESCTQRAIVVDGAPPSLARLGCESFARVGAEMTGGAVYTLVDGACAQQQIGGRVYEVGEPVEVAYATREREGHGRIQPIDDVAGLARIPDGLLYDAVLGADCGLSPVDGVTRCLPAAAPLATYFTDALCTMPRDVAVLSSTCGAPERFAFRDAYHAIGAVVTDPLYVPSTADTCMVQPPAGEPHDVGPVLAAETFVPAM